MKKIVIVFSILCLLFTANLFVYAENVYSEGGFKYTDNGGSLTIVGYTGDSTVVTVPNLIAGEPVSRIAKGAFLNTNVKTVYLPDSVVEIEENAFSGGTKVIYLSDAEAGVDSDDEDLPDTSTTEGGSTETTGTTGSTGSTGTTETKPVEGSIVSENIENNTSIVIIDAENQTEIGEAGFEDIDDSLAGKDIDGQPLNQEKNSSSSESTNEKDQKSGNWIWLIAIIGMVIAVGGMIFVWIKDKSKKK